jgi:hypothetical protein
MVRSKTNHPGGVHPVSKTRQLALQALTIFKRNSLRMWYRRWNWRGR